MICIVLAKGQHTRTHRHEHTLYVGNKNIQEYVHICVCMIIIINNNNNKKLIYSNTCIYVYVWSCACTHLYTYMHLYYTYMHTGCSLLFIAHIDTRRYQLLTTTIYRSIILLLFLQKQNLATAIYLFGLGTLCAYSFVRGRVHAHVLHTYIRICTPYIPYIPYIHT